MVGRLCLLYGGPQVSIAPPPIFELSVVLVPPASVSLLLIPPLSSSAFSFAFPLITPDYPTDLQMLLHNPHTPYCSEVHDIS